MSNLGIQLARNNAVVNPASRSLLSNTGAPTGITINQFRPDITGLNKFDTKCLLVQLAELESGSDPQLVQVGNPAQGVFSGTTTAGQKQITLINADNIGIKIGSVANLSVNGTGGLGDNTLIVAKSVGGNITAGNFVVGCSYTVSSVGTTDFSLIGGTNSIGNVFTANSVGTGTGTAIGSNNQIVLTDASTVSGSVSFFVSPLKLGRYQITQTLLTNAGYLQANGAWSGKNGIDSREVFLSSTTTQDLIVKDYIQEKYVELIKSGAIKAGDSKEIIAGMLALSYQYQDFGNPALAQTLLKSDGTINLENYSVASWANVWRSTGQTSDSQGRPGHIYFNAGRYAVSTLGADRPSDPVTSGVAPVAAPRILTPPESVSIPVVIPDDVTIGNITVNNAGAFGSLSTTTATVNSPLNPSNPLSVGGGIEVTAAGTLVINRTNSYALMAYNGSADSPGAGAQFCGIGAAGTVVPISFIQQTTNGSVSRTPMWISTDGNVVITTTTASTSTTTGALVVRGGAGFDQNINVGGLQSKFGTQDASQNYVAIGGNKISFAYTAAENVIDINNDLIFRVLGDFSSIITLSKSTKRVTVHGTQSSTSTATGALVVTGGAGIGGRLNVGGNIVAASGTASTSTTTGALVVEGGVGIAGNINIGGNIFQQTVFYERFSNVTNSGGNLTCNLSLGSIFYASPPLSTNVTANFTNIDSTLGYTTGSTIIFDNGAAPFTVSNIQINGTQYTIRWVNGLGGLAPLGLANNTSIISFSFIPLAIGSYRVLGQLASFR